MLLNELAQDVQQGAIIHKVLDSHSKAPITMGGYMNYLITRHPGALEWMSQQIKEPTFHLDHLGSLSCIGRSDTVIGTLPVNLVAELCSQKVRYFHLEVDLPQHLRGQELTAQQLVELGAELVEYHAHRLVADETVLQQATEREEWSCQESSF